MISTIGVIVTILGSFNTFLGTSKQYDNLKSIISTIDYEYHRIYLLMIFIVILIILCIILSGSLFLLTLIPRIDNKTKVQKTSYIFFRDLAKSNPKKIANHFTKINNPNEDLINQILSNAKIAYKKMKYCNLGLKTFGIGFLLIIFLVILYNVIVYVFI